MDIIELDQQALTVFGDVVHRVAGMNLTWPTPCAEWDVRSLVNHVIDNNRLFAAAARGDKADLDSDERDRVGSDPSVSFEDSARDVRDSFDGIHAGVVFHLPFGDLPAHQAIAVHFVDVLVHAWDLAMSIGEPAALPDDLAQAAIRIASAYPAEAWGASRFFGQRISVPNDARAQDRLVGLLGRHPFDPLPIA